MTFKSSRRLAEIALDSGYEQVLAARTMGLNQIAYAVDRESQAVLSVLRLVPADRKLARLESLKPPLDHLRRFGEDQSARQLRQAGDPARATAKSQRCVRKRMGAIPLDGLAPDRREG